LKFIFSQTKIVSCPSLIASCCCGGYCCEIRWHRDRNRGRVDRSRSNDEWDHDVWTDEGFWSFATNSASCSKMCTDAR